MIGKRAITYAVNKIKINHFDLQLVLQSICNETNHIQFNIFTKYFTSKLFVHLNENTMENCNLTHIFNVHFGLNHQILLKSAFLLSWKSYLRQNFDGKMDLSGDLYLETFRWFALIYPEHFVPHAVYTTKGYL